MAKRPNVTEEQLYEQLGLLKNRVEFLEDTLDDKRQELERAKRIAGDIVSALCNAIENGQQLHIGIVLGQSIKELQELQYS